MRGTRQLASLAVASALILGSQLSFAELDVFQAVSASSTVAVSAGSSVAKNRIGVVDASGGGTVVQNINASNTVAISLGSNSTACNEIGVVGPSDCRGE